MKRKILILGGGFGGIKTALELADDDRFDIKLVSDRTDFRYYPALYRTATGGSQAQSRIPLSDIFEGKNISINQDEAIKLDREKQLVHGKSGKTYGYDSLVISLGVVTNYFGIKGLKDYSFGIKSIEEAEELKSHIHEQLFEEGRPDLNYIVIGGGPTGVELAGALPAYIKKAMDNHGIKHRAVRVALVEATPRLLPRMPKDVSRSVAKRLRKLKVKLYLGKKVEGQTSDSLMVEGKPIESETVVWTAGVTNHPFLKANDFKLNPAGKATVNQYLQAEPDIYVAGDNADTPYSGLAQTALWDGLYLAKHLKQMSNNENPDPYTPRKPIYVVPAGPKWAAVLWGKVRIYGRVGWWLRRTADLIGYHDLEPWWDAGQHWMEENVSEEECPHCKKR
jgi:NADH dehydrogenase